MSTRLSVKVCKQRFDPFGNDHGTCRRRWVGVSFAKVPAKNWPIETSANQRASGLAAWASDSLAAHGR